MKQYLVTIYERWEFGSQWSYIVSTNNVESIDKALKKQYNRFTVTERT